MELVFQVESYLVYSKKSSESTKVLFPKRLGGLKDHKNVMKDYLMCYFMSYGGDGLPKVLAGGHGWVDEELTLFIDDQPPVLHATCREICHRYLVCNDNYNGQCQATVLY